MVLGLLEDREWKTESPCDNGLNLQIPSPVVFVLTPDFFRLSAKILTPPRTYEYATFTFTQITLAWMLRGAWRFDSFFHRRSSR